MKKLLLFFAILFVANITYAQKPRFEFNLNIPPQYDYNQPRYDFSGPRFEFKYRYGPAHPYVAPPYYYHSPYYQPRYYYQPPYHPYHGYNHGRACPPRY